MRQYEFALVSSLAKVFADEKPQAPETLTVRSFAGRKAAFQLVYSVADKDAGGVPVFGFDAELKNFPGRARFFSVELMPSNYPVHGLSDERYLRRAPGMYPDLLQPLAAGADGNTFEVYPIPGQYRSVWLQLDLTDVPEGTYALSLEIRQRLRAIAGNGVPLVNETPEATRSLSLTLEVGPALSAEWGLLHTEWFHTDGLANFYNAEVWSETHWRAVEAHIKAAAEHGVNLLLTPVFTPPLDTVVGSRRLCTQLIDIEKTAEGYTFGFERLKRWLGLCREYGIANIEVPHFFTQWGAHATPQIRGLENGEEKELFGWDVPATDPSYRRFLEALVPALRDTLAEAGYDERHVYFHISDEPTLEMVDSYVAAQRIVKPLLPPEQVIDALSSYVFYEKGLVRNPVAATDHIGPFLEHQVPTLWAYYCTSQCMVVPNRFFSMPSGRSRVMGVLLYYHGIRGFLHWGFNFYNSQFSKRPINPFAETDAGKAFPSGDAFLVYPGPGGEVWSSVRAEVQDDAWIDHRMLEAVERKAGRDAALALIREAAGGEISFADYPIDDSFFDRLRALALEALAQ